MPPSDTVSFMASNKKLRYKAGDLLKAKWNAPDSIKYILILEATPNPDRLITEYYILNLLSGEKQHVQRITVESYYSIHK
jgi:hypothetical protein